MTIAQGSATILLAEHSQALREMIAEMLESAGHTVLAARSPAEAVRIAQQHSGPIDLLLTDVVMPGMRGPELAETLRAIRPGLKALLMSGYTQPTADADGPRVVNADFIQKPFSEAVLLAKVSEALGRPS